MVTRIDSNKLRLGMFIHKLGGSWMSHPFLRKKFLLKDAEDISRILEAGIEEVWIDETKGESLATDPPQTIQTRSSETAAIAQKKSANKIENSTSMEAEAILARKFCNDAKLQVMAMYQEARLGKAIDLQTTLPLVNEVDTMVQRNPAAIISVARLKTHDDYTFMHSVAVCALMVSLAHQLNLDETQVKLAGVGGLMHDLGKALMPAEVLNKPGKLTEAEYDIMKKHPAAGARLLEDSGADPAVVDIALHHHEKMNGLGYPNRLPGEQISLLSRMAAVCDVYDAVTSERAYKHAWDPAGTIRQMSKWQGHFDKEVFNAFVKMVGIYPVGSLVRLASQKLAVVIEPGTTSLVTPKVKVFFSLRSKAAIPMKIVDLAESHCQDSIEGPEDPTKWRFKQLDDLWQ